MLIYIFYLFKSNDFKNIDTYISQIQDSTSEKDLPNILIVCYHTKRYVVIL